jgi:hypothetical protein
MVNRLDRQAVLVGRQRIPVDRLVIGRQVKGRQTTGRQAAGRQAAGRQAAGRQVQKESQISRRQRNTCSKKRP